MLLYLARVAPIVMTQKFIQWPSLVKNPNWQKADQCCMYVTGRNYFWVILFLKLVYFSNQLRQIDLVWNK